MQQQLKMVKEFHNKLGPFSCEDVLIPQLREEVAELLVALNEHNRVNILKEIADVLYVLFGICLERKIPIESVFSLVHQSNMTKEKSFPRFRGPNYKPVSIPERW